MLKKLLIIAWVGFIGLTVSCKGPEGDVGPQGEKGDTGAQGPPGPAGQNGTGGGSTAFVFTSGADTTDADGYFSRGLTMSSAAEAAAFLQESAILVYVKAQGAYWALPGLVNFGTGKQSQYTFVHLVEGSTLWIDIVPLDWSENQNTAPVRIAQDIKVIIIPASSGMRKNSAINWNNYEEAIAALGLTDKDAKKISLKRRVAKATL
jgi:hypothetical protein